MKANISNIDYRQIIEYSLEPIIIHTDLNILYINHAAEEFFGVKNEEIIGESPLDIFQDTSKPAIENRIQSAYEKPAEVIEEKVYITDGSIVEVELYCHPVLIENTKAIQTYVRDVTNRKLSEKKHSYSSLDLADIKKVLVPILDGIAVLPLVGAIDEVRAKQLLDAVPVKVQKQNVECLIIDFSGIYNIDTIVSDSLFKINRVLSMLGVRTIITGIRPELALTAIELDIDWASTTTMSTVKDALYSLGLNLK